jgi:chromosome segregation ATPase
MSYLKLGATIFACLAITAFVWASESDEIRAKAEAMQREAAQLAERGHEEEAANLKRRAMEMLEEAERLQHRPDQRRADIMEMNRLLETLRLEEKELEELGGKRERLEDIRREAERIEMELRELSHQPHPEQAAPHEEIARRLEHMRIAVEHLNHAGLHDVAEHVAKRAEAAERELHEREPRRQNEGDVMHEVMKQLDEMRQELGRLRDEVNELREKR